MKFRFTSFFGPTRLGVSLVYPITVTVKNNPNVKISERINRKEARRIKRNGGDE